MNIFYRLGLWTVAISWLGFMPVQGRMMSLWTYQDLLDKSDLVVIIEPIANEKNTDKMEWEPEYCQGISTTFTVRCCLKGTTSSGTIIVRHFIYKDQVPANAGELIHFLIGPLRLKASYERDGKVDPWDFGLVTPQWLAFLVKAPDGSYIPVSGQIDPNFSFRELNQASMYASIYTDKQ